jgi:polyhydroxyalkanoate synthesis regulator phasin
MMALRLSGSSYICGMEWRAKHLISAQQLTPVSGGIYEGQLVVWDVADAHGDVFTRQTKFHIHGEPPVYLEHNYFAPPVGKIIHFSEREDGLYVALKLDRPLENMNGVHLSVGGFAIGEAREDGTYEIKEMAVFEASLTPTPAQPNSELVLLMKTLSDMATEKEKMTLENTSGQATQKMTIPTGALGYLRKQDLAQLEAFVTELAARVEALENLPAQIADLQQKLNDLAAAVSQIQSLTQQAVAQATEKALEVVKEQIQPFAKELVKDMNLLSDLVKIINKQRI